MAVHGWLKVNHLVSSRSLILAVFLVFLSVAYVVSPNAPIVDQNSSEYKIRLAAAESMFEVITNRGAASKAQLIKSTAGIITELPKADPKITPDQVARITALFSSMTERYYEDIRSATIDHYARYYSRQDIETYGRWLRGDRLGRPDRRLRIGFTAVVYGHELESTLSKLADGLDEKYEVIANKAKAIAAEK